MKRAAIILGNYKDYAEKYLAECIDSLRKQKFDGEIKIFIYDNATSPQNFLFLSENAPEAELILNKDNDGFAKGNNDAIKLALAQGFEYIILFNLDMVIDDLCVDEMVSTAESDRKIGAVQARIMLWPETEKINSIGNVTHFLGFGYCDSYGLTHPAPRGGAPLSRGDYQNIAYPSGAAVLFRADVLKQVGLFDEEFWMYNEDQDLGWRIWLAGYRCVLAWNAVAYHKYEFSRSAGKYYWLDRNRIIAIWKNYHLLTLLLIMPAFLVMELGLIVFSFQSGWKKEKMQVWKYLMNPAHWPYLIRARRSAQKLRRVKDKAIVRMFSGRIWYQEIDDIKLRLINPVFSAYWRIAKKIIIW